MRNLGKRTIQIGIALGAIVGLVGCGQENSDVQAASHEDYGLSSINGWSSINGLSSLNGFSSINRRSSINGLTTPSAGRKTISYFVKCALPANDTLVKQDQNSTNNTFA